MTTPIAKRGAADPARRQPVRVGVVSLGCAKNLVDTEVMLGHLDRAGCEFVQDPQDADVILVNTCAFIEPAREESVRTILEAAELKTRGRLKRLVVAGCMVQRYRDELAESLPEVDAFIGLDQLEQVVTGVDGQGRTLSSPSLPLVSSRGKAWGVSKYLYDHDTPRRTATPAWSAYLKIAEGCDHTCAFCAIPSFRGAFRSRTIESIVTEAEQLVRGGVRELNLIAQDSSHYGKDLGLQDGLPALLRRLDGIEDLRWIRVHYLYPNTVTDALIDTMRTTNRVLNYVDIPLQHAHPETLKRMRRGGSAKTHAALLDRFRAALPDATLRSTFIVGFPGETDEEFEALLQFVREQRFHNLGVFTYSHEESTPAQGLEDDVPEATKVERRERLMALQQQVAFEHGNGMIGRTVEVLVEGAHPETEHLLVGRSAAQSPDVDGQVLINEGLAQPGSFVTVEVSDTAGYDLVGRVVEYH